MYSGKKYGVKYVFNKNLKEFNENLNVTVRYVTIKFEYKG